MTTTRLTPAGISALAALVHDLRPTWDTRGIAWAIHRLTSTVDAHSLALAFIHGSLDTTNDTPAALIHLDNRAWTTDAYPRCPDHPETRGRKPNGQCAACWTNTREDPNAGAIRDRGGKPIPDDARRQLVGAIGHRNPAIATPETATEEPNP